MGKTPARNECPFDSEAKFLEHWRIWSVPSFSIVLARTCLRITYKLCIIYIYIYIYIYINIYIVIHRQICFVLSELISVARRARFPKLGSKHA